MRKLNFEKVKKISVICFCIFLISSSFVFAASKTRMSYDGKGILNKDSVHNFTLSSRKTITVKHTTTKFHHTNNNKTMGVTIYLKKKSGLFYHKTGDDFSVSGKKTFSKSWKKSAGTYKLHFETYGAYRGVTPTADIKGTIK